MVELVSACIGFVGCVVGIVVLIKYQDHKKQRLTEDEAKLRRWNDGPPIQHKEEGTIFLDSARVSKELRDSLARRRKG
jgi:hypothetical protein